MVDDSTDQSDHPPDAAGGEALPDYVRGLSQPSAYPHAPDRVEVVQTHISYAFLAGDLVYKTKKPVDFGFIDQIDPATRERFCHREVELNRRLAPDVYLGVVPVVRRGDGSFAVDATEGEIVEWAVKMRRLSDERTLAALLEARLEPPDVLERLVERLTRFHDRAQRVENDPAFAGAAAVRAWWTREYAEAAGNIGGTWSERDAARTREFFDDTIATQSALFDERLAAGRVVEGHGDLHAKHVYVLGPDVDDLAIVDCIEFTDWFQFRYLDVGYDVAFLAMDLEARGRPAMGDELAGRYIARSGDETMGVLQPLHRAFRAFVRGKVESIGATAPEVPEVERRRLGESASAYFRLAARYAERSAGPALVVLSGLSGTGKSTVAGTLAARIGAAYVASDHVRRALAGPQADQGMWQQFEAGLYSPEMSRRTYEEMRRRAAAHLAAGRPVVLDAMHGRAADRAAALEVARAAGTPALLVELRLAGDAALARVAHRERERFDTRVDADAFREHVDSFEPISSAEGRHLALDGARPVGELAEEIAEELQRAR